VIRRVLRAYPTLLRVGFADAVAYRVEFLIWILSTNMPLVMLALWQAVAEGGDVGRFSQKGFLGYYLASLLVRLLTGVWVGFEIANDIRQGTLALKLLRPLHPLFAYSAENLAALPMRGIVTLPVVLITLVLVGDGLTHDPVLLGLFVLALAGAWLLGFFIQAMIGSLGLFIDKSMSLAELYFGLFSVLSGYLIPLELFPAWMQTLTHALPFYFQLGYPVEVLTGHLSRTEAVTALGYQWAWVFGTWAVLWGVWQAGMRRYQSFGG
jgi:ABC-2 type transport system permease protein